MMQPPDEKLTADEIQRQARPRTPDVRPLDDVANYAWIALDDQHRLAVAVTRALDDGASTDAITESMRITEAELPGILGVYLPMCVEHGLEVEENPLPSVESLTFACFAKVNSARAARWHEDLTWSPSEWMTALVGEVGEAANIIKKLNRSRDGLVGNDTPDTELRKALAEELADVLVYLFLLAEAVDVDLEDESISKFNEVSIKRGFPERLDVATGRSSGAKPSSVEALAEALKQHAERLKVVERYLTALGDKEWWDGDLVIYEDICRDLKTVRMWMESDIA